MRVGRREFLRRFSRAGGGALLAPSMAGLASWNCVSPDETRAATARRRNGLGANRYGALRPGQACPELHIPADFHCVRLSVALSPSPVRRDLAVPNAFDGMAAFALSNGNVRLIRNHEMVDRPENGRAIGSPYYDAKCSGGTTSLEVRITGSGTNLSVELVDEFVSLAGTHVNCAGGLTPWGSWLSCEETTNGHRQGFDQSHGYIFEVPADATGPVDPVPLRDMGRYIHEAVAVDPGTGLVYETEDAWYNPDNLESQPGAGLYRFIPNRRDALAEGGRLSILAVREQPNFVTARGMAPGTTVPVTWLPIEDPDPASAETDSVTVFREGLSKGAAVFARLEGAFAADGGIYVVSTNGGNARAGQIFLYRPDGEDDGELTLVFESPSNAVLDSPDNICVSPHGDLVLCEDGGGDQFIRCLDREGAITDLVRNPASMGRTPGEFAGGCFSPDGRVLFFNTQGGRDFDDTVASVTYAMWGPWSEASG